MTRLAALVCLSLAAAGSVTAQSGCPKKLQDANWACETNFQTARANLTYPSSGYDALFKTFATCNCETFAEYPTREALIAVCPSIWGEGNKDNYPKFKEACASGAYNNVLTTLKYTLSVQQGNGTAARYNAPFQNAEGKVVSGSSAPILANDAGKLAKGLFAAAAASAGVASLILTVM
ncbi:uncharacterized protein SPPG_03681 [Spizellomyces punctatus DAOM BR117]|uniref:Secreted protein n=1 Tax=Spizellomyces punctatus (strain DAOM BR117) TaxID=645134 RepID=A0A0L0HLV5_SPIPD|nr:uncharacterized protein SPPG_03681 [Spizellomyces punctatus DAOM BR117]KND01895.1 hypothetical protein SPPG_03681 [Spizellomyces punctatus DAOM BR117]|eukprot:XP_016609934.1 hypothetical protein SPPG_03681 [Spizellomyces punctatus DAOM BR117]